MRATPALVVGLILGAAGTVLGVYFYFATGMAPVATVAAPMPFEKMLAHKALNARIHNEMPKTVPIAADESTFLAGAKVYRDDCAVCHGLPGQQKTAIAAGMYPDPPKLLEGKGVTDDGPGETYWKVANGICLTGMPGFRKSLSDTQLWQVSLLLADADKLPQIVRDGLGPATAGANALPGETPKKGLESPKTAEKKENK